MISKALRRLNWRAKPEAIIRRFFADMPPCPSPHARVLHYVGISSMYLTPMEILFYHLLRQRGYAVDYLVYDTSVPINEILTKDREESEGREKFFNRSCANGERLLKAANVEYQYIPVDPQAIKLAQQPEDLEALLDFQHEGIDFGNIVRGTMYRYYKSLKFGENALDIARRALTTTLSNYFCVRDRCATHNYEFVAFSHGIYMTWQPVVEFCERNKLDYFCYDRAKTRNYGNFNANQPSPDWSIDDAWDRYATRSLTKDETAQVHKYLRDRETQSCDVYSYNPSARAENLVAERERLGIPANRRVITVFTNLIWDAANVCRDVAFPNALECVLATIEHFRDREDVQVVLRSHPAEKVIGTSDRYAERVLQHFDGNLPENVTLVTPEDAVNSFTIIDLTDIGIVNTSTVGLEMAALGKPVILIAQTHYRGKGFTHNATSAEHYFQQLEQLLTTSDLLPRQVELAEKYFYLMMFRYQQKMPTRYSSESIFTGYSVPTFGKLLDDEPLVAICDRLISGMPTDFVTWPQHRGHDTRSENGSHS